ncbi:MAG: radical SAM protein, partial [Candidatus Aenigmatarchaeota archaeon]
MEVLAETESICPECAKEGKINKIDAKRVEENGKVYLVKECPEHGEFKSIISSEPEQYKKFRKYWETGEENSTVKSFDLYDKHYSQSVLTNLFVTNRCDLRCSYCFANAGAEGYVYNPSLEQLKKQMKVVREQRPVPSKAIQITGGEPAVRDDLPEIIKMADEMGFSHIQVNTNGIRAAEDHDFVKEWKEAGCDTIYMSFDGVTKDVNPWIEQNKKALENFKEVGITSVILVPTIIKGHNDGQLADIIDFAAEHIDVVRGVNFQPISFVGRLDKIDDETRDRERISFSEIHEKIQEQTDGSLKIEDWYPPTFVTPISDLIANIKGEPQVKFGCSPNCGSATYAFLDDDGSLVPITHFVDVEGLMEFIKEKAKTEGK